MNRSIHQAGVVDGAGDVMESNLEIQASSTLADAKSNARANANATANTTKCQFKRYPTSSIAWVA